ncbi:MAG: FIST C-terminal domain-containing protein [Phycisphaeraceae bacterium]|nr:FIST C-terminal domain-containing protein [Phycisphaeraceae bacterium]MCB9848308.1 FIST C-terminal domain-containing protein [Phycisphaeraceae bacterium]
MKTQTLRYDGGGLSGGAAGGGWSESFADLDSPSTLILVFGDTALLDDPAPIRELRRRFPESHMLGCSTSGQFIGEAISDKGLVASVIRFERGSVRLCKVNIGSSDASSDAGREVGKALSAPDLKGVFVLSDGTRTNGSLLAEGLRASIPAGTPISGGLAGDGERFERTWVCCDGDPESGAVVAVGVYGEGVGVWNGCQGGWEPFGPERTVTRSCANVLHELDGKPALGVYEEYLGDVAREMPAAALRYPLALKRPDNAAPVVRTVLGVSREEQTMTFAGDIPEGSKVQLMRSTSERLVEGARSAIEMAPGETFENRSSVCVSISCVGRRLMLRHRAEEELEIIAERLPEGAPQIGFYSYGELSPMSFSSCELHNQTMTLTIFNEVDRGGDASIGISTAA